MKTRNRKNKLTRRSRQALTGSRQIAWLPKPDFNPKWPSKGTHVYLALILMLHGRKITSLDFQSESSSQRLAANIHVLLKLGWPVEAEDVLIIFEQEPHKRIFSQYSFDVNFLKKFTKFSGGAAW
jgi:hypothetical protein